MPLFLSSQAWRDGRGSAWRVARKCVDAYDETLRKERGGSAGKRISVYIMRCEYWRVRPGRAVSLRRGTGHRLMGQIMLRLIRTGSTFVGLEQREGR